MKCKLLNVNSFAFHVIKTLLEIVEAFQEPYCSHDTSLISIMYAKPSHLTVKTMWLAPF